MFKSILAMTYVFLGSQVEATVTADTHNVTNGFRWSNKFWFSGMRNWYTAIKGKNVHFAVEYNANGRKYSCFFRNFTFTNNVTFEFDYADIQQKSKLIFFLNPKKILHLTNFLLLSKMELSPSRDTFFLLRIQFQIVV